MALLQFTNASFNDLQISKLDWSIDRRDAKQNDFFKSPIYFSKNDKIICKDEYGYIED